MTSVGRDKDTSNSGMAVYEVNQLPWFSFQVHIISAAAATNVKAKTTEIVFTCLRHGNELLSVSS